MKDRKPYRIIAAYDSETSNLNESGIPVAFPILHQLGLLDGTDLAEITADNVKDHVDIELYRHTLDLEERLNDIAARETDYVPVILCHNLSFDMYGLSNWLSGQNMRVLAKSARKPITFTILDENDNPRLVIWDTLIFSQQSLERMGKDCGFQKGVGEWNYNLVRTPFTPLTDTELDYAKRDIYTLIAWFGWWIRRNPDISPDKLGANVVTKTGIVRERRRVRFSKLRGRNMKSSVFYYWKSRCRLDAPKTDDELFTMLACTRGGFTFCSSVNASKPFDLTGTDDVVAAFDATSQHPAQMVSHMYPYRFREMPANVLDLAFDLIGKISFERVLEKWEKPFPVAFNACFEFENLRPKAGSLFERFGIFPLASARYKTPEQILMDEDNGDKAAYDEHLRNRSYCDSAEGAKCAFGKVISADCARFYLTELAAWEVWQAYEWDSVKAIHGYETGKFCRANDIDTISVMQFYKAKNEFKKARKSYYKGKPITNGKKLKELGVSDAIVKEMEDLTISAGDVEATYMSLKADLNSLFGISCSNSYRRDTVITHTGIEYVGNFGICNAPKTPKVWYQFGQRIVGWSRIAQICAMYLVEPYAKTIINGDTDSIKLVCAENDLPGVQESLQMLSRAVDKGKEFCCTRVRYAYPKQYDPLREIGYYVPEFTTKRFCASWNKAYCVQDENGFAFTLAGIPTRKRQNDFSSFIGINGYADRLYKLGWSFADVCNLFLGYNVTFAHDIIKMNARKFPEWESVYFGKVTDYLGNTYNVAEVAALALYPMSKTVNDISSADNRQNMRYALVNNPNVNTVPKIVHASGILDFEGIF